MKKILIFTPHFDPETQIINDVIYSYKDNFDFTVVTSFPHYPNKHLYKNYYYLKDSIVKKNGIKIIRLPVTPRIGKNLFFLSVNYLSYVVLSMFLLPYLLFLSFDKIFIFQTSPITVALTPIILSKLKKIKTTMWILDLWPETLSSFDFPMKKIVIKFFDFFVKFIYRNCKIFISSKGFKESLKLRNFRENDIIFLPQWADRKQSDENIDNLEIYFPPKNSFIITFAGNIGNAQDIESIGEAIKLCKYEKKIHWLFLGDGSKKEYLVNLKKNESLDNLHLLGAFPKKYMNSFFKRSSCLLLTLKDSEAFNPVLPAKLQSYMNSGKPILTMASGEVSKVVFEANIGLIAKSSDYEKLYQNILSLRKYNSYQLEQIKINSFQYLNTNFNRDRLLKKINDIAFN